MGAPGARVTMPGKDDIVARAAIHPSIGVALLGSAPQALLRNAAICNRNDPVIDPGPRHITGVSVRGGPAYSFDSGRSMGIAVYLGEVRTDSRPRYGQVLTHVRGVYRQRLAYWYRAETRWTNAPFWQRRHFALDDA